ncbi:putative disease resistance RPP13-like protein 1 [Rutidosis leptorrhynchoides]|uniref:putative disease resistance RPP13-like protein 1 n=1 Tax=Rutidosis leptorrhynchoides TaxID=125765 RepID=UPI003A9A0936
MVFAEIFLGAFFQVLFDRLAPRARDLWNLASHEGLEKKLEKLNNVLLTIQSVLVDAEQKQLTNNAVKEWLHDLRHLSYDAEDVLDEFSTESLKRKVISQRQAGTSKIKKLIPARLTPNGLVFRQEMGSKIKKITDRLNDVSNRRNMLGLQNSEGVASGFTDYWQRTPTTSLPDNRFYGRDDDKKNIIDLLLAVKDFFQIKAWVCISIEFDVLRITKAILEEITLESCDLKELNPIQRKLEEVLALKTFLIILDDVWNKNHALWDALKRPFMAGAQGSKLQHLSAEDCWSIFKKHAFENEGLTVKFILEKVIDKCRGLPLAARTLGGLLRSKHVDEWEHILNSSIWSLPEGENDIFPVLRLSYHYLPPELKRCFAYCAIFPQDYEFTESELVRLWMAEGFIEHGEMEETGGKYFRELVSRSFFQLFSNDDSKYVMHDLIHELGQWAAGETCFRKEDHVEEPNECQRITRARHSSYNRGERVGIKKFKAFHEGKCLRSFLPLPINPSLSGYHISELPDSIGDLKHLRYLDLSYTLIGSLPESTSSLYNLQSFILRDCSCLKKLPSRICNLINLRHLEIMHVELVSELINFKSLRGSLSISNLETVTDAGDARDAHLNEKQSLNDLVLKWNSNFDISRDAANEKIVLDMLRPNEKLEELSIKYYAGVEFPLWLGDISFSNIKSISLENCENATCLPPLGKLSHLK